ncbi:hypothetical protein [Sphingomonas crocodyli]|uniref:Uncharacterized protein n=1 Tax=Sphingomonas crocodyli TaxID=1979270 RepID=A0A437M8A6_9SPHN|nr:hypothetical protein [Sphingomonas crocodyli]RVT93765.1 hypothetical protein EOD43_07840 [Sphingomonas crocodyli]
MLGLLIAASVAASNPGWAKFSRQTIGIGPTVTIGRFDEKGTKRSIHWFRFQEDVRVQKDKARTLWADSRNCPAVRTALDALSDVRFGVQAPPDRNDGPVVIQLDGVGYTFENRLAFGPGKEIVSIYARERSPLAIWIDATLDGLKPCWSETAPEQ